MPQYQFLQWCLYALWGLLVFAYGACLGSLINVIVYRMPKGISIVSPPSRCPSCSTKLSWRDNIPVFGWIMLRGKCRYCKTRISPEYPIVEAAVGLLFVVFYMIWYVAPGQSSAGEWWRVLSPSWAIMNDASRTWPEFAVLLILVASLFAMTLVDAKTFTIPIELTWVPAVVAVVVYPLHAAWVSRPGSLGVRTTPGWNWMIACPDVVRWDWIGLSIGGIVGIGIAVLLLRMGLIGRSFADYAEWEAKAKAAEEAALKATDGEGGTTQPQTPTTPELKAPAAEGVASPEAGTTPPPEAPNQPALSDPNANPDMWMAYPHARREMVLELAFVAPCVLLMLVGWYAGRHFGGVRYDSVFGVYSAAMEAPLWLAVLSGVLLGYLIGGGLVWFVRIFGSFAFGKEAMGLGDVHLMAGVGAALGWITSTLGFFGAAFVGIGWALLGRLAGGGFKRILPYGPFLAVATILVVLCKPVIELGLSYLTGQQIRLP